MLTQTRDPSALQCVPKVYGSRRRRSSKCESVTAAVSDNLPFQYPLSLSPAARSRKEIPE